MIKVILFVDAITLRVVKISLLLILYLQFKFYLLANLKSFVINCFNSLRLVYL
jgi:hypothetical protein